MVRALSSNHCHYLTPRPGFMLQQDGTNLQADQCPVGRDVIVLRWTHDLHGCRCEAIGPFEENPTGQLGSQAVESIDDLPVNPEFG